jgi:hypothetical protein
MRAFVAITDNLNEMADWLLACGVDTVALESTGVYWIPNYEVPARCGPKVWLADACQIDVGLVQVRSTFVHASLVDRRIYPVDLGHERSASAERSDAAWSDTLTRVKC